MDANKIASDNHAFFYVAVGQHMCAEDFKSAVMGSFYEPALYGIKDAGFSGYINIDCADIRERCSHGSFADAVRNGIFGKAAMKLPRSIKGEMNAEAEIIIDHWKFSFTISKYERDSAHDFEMVQNPLMLPGDNERLGRFVDLKVTLVQ